MTADNSISPEADPLGNIVVILLNRNGDIAFVCQRGCRLLGGDAGQLLGRHLCDVFPSPAFSAICRSLIAEVLEGQRAFACTSLPVAIAGQPERPVSLRIEPHRDSTGRIEGCLCLCIEGDEIHPNFIHWQHTPAFTAAVLDNAMEAILTIDVNGTIFGANVATETIFGYRREELLGKNISCLMPSPDREAHDHYIQHYIDTGEARIIGTRREVTGRHRDGSLIPLELTIGEVVVHGERGFTGMLRDISAQKAAAAREEEIHQARERLQQLDRINIANQLATGIAHEINQPLATIGTYVRLGQELLGKTGCNPDLAADLLEKIDQQTQHAAQIIRSLRSLISKSPEIHDTVNINLLIEQTAELARQDLNAFNIDIEYLLDEALPEVDIIYIQIQQVLLNLIRNSRDALRDNHSTPSIIIESVVGDGDFVKVLVRDNGEGVSDEVAEKIFTPFYSSKRGPDNMGMGLPICQSIIESHGGVLRLNQLYREGAEFYFTLPVAEQFNLSN